MATLTDRNNPNFVLFPINNNRTAWRPFGLPVIMVVPHRTDPGGTPLANSGVFSTRVYIEDVPKEAKVAGHQHIGLRFPDKELYAVEISNLELADRLIPLQNLTITKSDGVTPVEFADAQTDDLLHYTTSTGVTDTIPYLVGAEYYDLSDILLDLELLPSDQYNIVYQTQYFRRTISSDGIGDFLCIDSNFQSLAIFKFKIDHPGKVLNEFYRLTPPPYLTDAKKSADTTIALYRPFTDILQDVMDEQDLLGKINWVFDAPAEAIPYLSSLLGWDLPYFPESLDQLRRAVLRRTVEFQNLKGSRRAIINIFRLFGFEVLISNLWWSSDGKRLIRPDERLPIGYDDEEITTTAHNQVEAVLSDYTVTDFTNFEIPFLFRPQELSGLDEFTALRDGGQITIISYVVTPGGPAQLALQAIVDQIAADPSGYGDTANCTTDSEGFLFPQALDDATAGKELAGFSQIHIAGKLGTVTDEILVGPVIPLTSRGTAFNRETNTLSLILNGNSEFTGYKVYSFTVYKRYEFTVPDILANLQSNRFDIQVLTQAFEEFADPVTLEFAVEFLYRIKAFHSLLNVIRTRIELTETYEVTDLCVGGAFAQRFDTDIGRLQVPPAIIPRIPDNLNDCSLFEPKSLGYKDSDILLRLRKLANLPEEHAAWKALDGREIFPNGDTRIAPSPAADRDACKFTHLGQDRISVQERIEVRDTIHNPTPNANMGDSGYVTNQLSPNDVIVEGDFEETGPAESSNSDSSAYGSFTRERTQIRQVFCDLDKITDYCYKGRVEDELLYRPTLKLEERGGTRPIYIGMGIGVYWLYPVVTKVARPGVRTPDRRSFTNRMRFSGGAPEGSQEFYSESSVKDYLKVPYDKPLPAKNNSLLGRLYRDYDSPTSQTLHYSNRRGSPIIDQRQQLALQRPSLEITKPHLHFPGCRFPLLQGLTADFTHPTYTARPWDQNPCGPKNICGKTEPDYLNYHMIIDTEGNEQLEFDTVPYTVLGNNFVPDIPSLGDHTLGTDALFTADGVIHKVYMKNADGNPAVTFDGVCDYDSAVSVDETLETADPLFPSHNQCGTGIIDFADGYPCLRGYQPYTPPSLGQGVYEDLLLGLGVPTVSGTDTPPEVLFLLGSGIRDTGSIAYRLDAGCLLVGCGTIADASAICSVGQYLDQDGKYDWDPDHLIIEARLLEVEQIGVELQFLDGSIPSLMELV